MAKITRRSYAWLFAFTDLPRLCGLQLMDLPKASVALMLPLHLTGKYPGVVMVIATFVVLLHFEACPSFPATNHKSPLPGAEHLFRQFKHKSWAAFTPCTTVSVF
jgi:hypothetical protein